MIRLKNATVAFRAQGQSSGIRVALNNVNLHIDCGEFIAVVGRNGSGKSTLGRVVTGLLPLSKGEIQFSSDKSGAPPRVQMVFQNADAQIVGETVYEDVCFGLENYAFPSGEMEARAQSALAQVGLISLIYRPVISLSGGQKALLCIASALAVEAKVLIFDESTAMLDKTTRQQILHVAHALCQTGRTIVWITQWMDEAACAQRIVGMESGAVAFDGVPRQFFYGDLSNQNHIAGKLTTTFHRTQTPCEQLKLSPPYTIQVAKALLSQGLRLPTLPLTTDELAREVSSLCPSK